ncbi:MAG: CBS domain-containing protein [Anaerolineae bacterium]|nr:CBS domain-containing protein [Anaerolineae bacterium]
MTPKTVADIMTRDVAVIDATATVQDALHMMRERGISSLLVRPEDPTGDWGIMTKRDIISKVVAYDVNPEGLNVKEIMTRPILRIPPDMTLRQVSNMMIENRVRRLPVFDHGRLVGIVSDTDLFRAVEEGGWGGHD